jgi:protease-4
MSLDADLIVDRRRMRRKLTFWRVLAIAVIVLGIAGLVALSGNRTGLFGVRPYIARVTVSGLIRGDQDRVEALDRLAQSTLARAVIVHVDSPGGTTAGSEQLFDSLSRLREKKPLVIVVDSLAASGGYITAIAGDHIVAQQTSLVGSIGVLFQYPNVASRTPMPGSKAWCRTAGISPTPSLRPSSMAASSPGIRGSISS